MHLISLPGSRLDTAPGRVRRGRAARLPAAEGLLVQVGGDAGARGAAGAPPGTAGWAGGGCREICYSLVTCGSAARPLRYDGGRSTSASGRSSAATRSAYPDSQVASSSARMRSSSGRSRRRAAAGRRREERRRQERRHQERPGEDCCRGRDCRGVTAPDNRTPRCRRFASETISTATTATAITPAIIHSPPVPVQLGYARLNDATPGTSGKWFMTESVELFGAVWPIAKGRPPLKSGPPASAPLPGRHRDSRNRDATEGPSLVGHRFRCRPI